MMGVLRSRDQGKASHVAPPHGLCLWEVGYESAI
jgi:tRNA U38,U39,U40 pseudouridine synthase TruA